MIYRDKNEKLNGLFLKFYRKIQSLLRSEKGQTLVEYSLLLGISSAISSSIAIFLDHPLIVIAIIVLLIFLLFWKPKVLATVVFIALLLSVLLFIYRWVEYGHI